MRGKDLTSMAAAAAEGITPAHAGKSGGGLWGNRQSEDHPRPCGEKGILDALGKG